ncbi:MAG: hypothetical protein DMF92_15715 [Acidobacteria bacterium]|nr:MAG: hypothetical protein DMF92_15715 [Acidobacteriota bacterium]
MVKRTLLASIVSLTFFAVAAPAIAHHSANAQFDTYKEFILTGVLTKLEEMNPHSRWHVDVKADDGTVTSWELEGVSPNSLRRAGVRVKDDLKIGGTYSFTVAPSKDGSHLAFLKAITIDGRLVQMVAL